MRFNEKDRRGWVAWLKRYGLRKFLNAFMKNAHGAQSTCVYCGEPIYLDLLEGGGVADWGTAVPSASGRGVVGLDYGCAPSPDTCEEGTGGHMPRRLGRTA